MRHLFLDANCLFTAAHNQHFGHWMNRADQTGGILIQTLADFLASL